MNHKKELLKSLWVVVQLFTLTLCVCVCVCVELLVRP